MVAYLVAVVIAPAAAVLEYRSSAKSPFAWEDGAWFWWVLRVLIEIVVAVVAVTAISTTAGASWAPAAIRGLAIGACVPAISRSYFVSIEQGSRSQKIGIAHFYDLVVDFVGGRISDIETEAESAWAQQKAYPVLLDLGWTANTLAFRLADVAERRLSDADFATLKSKLEETLREPISGERKLHETIAHARDVKAHRTLRRIVKERHQPPDVGLV